MRDEPATSVVIKQSILPGSPQPEFLQRVALVYINGEEYRVSAPVPRHNSECSKTAAVG